MHIVGLTGGTGAGKSTAARRFESQGIHVIDADRVGHELIAPGGDAVDPVAETFGREIVRCGKIDRGQLGRIVFADPEALASLNRIMRPRIMAVIAQQCADRAAEGDRACIVDAALLGDDGRLEPWLHALILVSSPEADRAARLMAQRAWTEAEAWERIRAQVDPESKRELARWVIENNGDLNGLYAQVDEIARILNGPLE